jgi:alkanesulfonate monooxygenase SsuD/methylene tetrahydromethanopterin reductase-like flavin-dependent oxidoreductase (luciferase family)
MERSIGFPSIAIEKLPPAHSTLLLAAALAAPDPDRLAALGRLADAAGLDLVTVEAGPLDPLLAAARLAAQTQRVGILAAAPTTATEPFHVSTAIATIDVISRGRGGWLAEVLPRDQAAGRVTWDVPADVHGDAAEHVEVVRRLWDSWEAGAEIRDTATDRFVDRDRIHHINYTGEHLAVRGPSITPRPPQGQPVIAVRDTDPRLRGLADVVLTRALEAPAGVPLAFHELDADAGGALADRLGLLHARGFHGVLLRARDLPGALEAVAGLRPEGAAPPMPLRERLGLPPVTNRYALATRG